MNCTPRSGTSFAYVVRISTQTSWWKRINCPLFISLPHLTLGTQFTIHVTEAHLPWKMGANLYVSSPCRGHSPFPHLDDSIISPTLCPSQNNKSKGQTGLKEVGPITFYVPRQLIRLGSSNINTHLIKLETEL